MSFLFISALRSTVSNTQNITICHLAAFAVGLGCHARRSRNTRYNYIGSVCLPSVGRGHFPLIHSQSGVTTPTPSGTQRARGGDSTIMRLSWRRGKRPT